MAVHLVVVDADPFTRQVISKAPITAHRVTYCDDATQAKEVMAQHEFDMLLVDLALPNAQQLLQANQIQLNRQCIGLVQGNLTNEIASSINQGQIQQVLVKPLQAEALQQALQACQQALGNTGNLPALDPGSLRRIVGHLPDGLLLVDENDRVRFINAAARDLLGLEPKARVDIRYLKDTLGFYPFDLVRSLAASERSSVSEEIRVRERMLHSTISAIIEKDELVGVLVVLRDISTSKHHALRQDEFTSRVSHELRTPLTTLCGALELLFTNAEDKLSAKQARHLQLARESSAKLNDIVDDLFELNQEIQAGKEPSFVTEPLELASVVRATMRHYLQAAEKQGVALKVDVAEELEHGIVLANRRQLQQVLGSLLANGLRYTDPGGAVRVDVFHTEDMPELIAVSVLNDGPEIKEADQQSLFDPQEQPLRRRGSVVGTEFGLEASKRIIEKHGGKIWIESRFGEGTRFVFTLPISKTQLPKNEKAHPALQPGSPPRFKDPPKLLLVDDDPAVAFVIKGMLMKMGCQVSVTHNGQQALDLARSKQPELIILDIQMQDINGLEVADILKHDPETCDIPIMMLSGDRREQEAYRVGAHAFLSKPVSHLQLKKAIEQVLEQRNNLQERIFRILIIDDDYSVRTICKQLLESQGYGVLEADNGQQGIELLLRFSVDIVLLDLMLPGSDGFQVAEEIRSNRAISHIPIIFLSASGHIGDKVRALKSGGDDYLVKPFDARELGARVESVIQRKEREQDSSPTTKLPGTAALQREIGHRIQASKAFSLCYLDLDNFKAFNDYYGYAKADGVICQLGNLINRVVDEHGSERDFVAHIAGDDFVLITEPPMMQKIAQEVIQNFDRMIPLYYNPQDKQRGYIVAQDRFGQQRKFGIMTISLAVLHVHPGSVRTPGELSQHAARLKQEAKAIEGSSIAQYEIKPKDPSVEFQPPTYDGECAKP